MAQTPTVSVIIPVLNDAAHLAQTLDCLGARSRAEVIVVDGGGHDIEMDGLQARHSHVQWLRSSAGRGQQMNVGAAHARGPWLLFLHADTQLPDEWLEELKSAERDPTVVGGSFRFQLESTSRWARLIERGVAARVRCLDLPYGDQALFVRREIFESLGGYRELPLMEDVEFTRRLRKAGRLYHSKLPVLTSARRWERDGWVRRSVENVILVLLFLLGVSPAWLAQRYRGHRETTGE